MSRTTAPGSPPGESPDPIALLAASHREQRSLCDTLEAIADSLPHEVNNSACLLASRALGVVLARARHLREQTLFPAARDHWLRVIDFTRTIERLEFEYLEDQWFAEEIAEALHARGTGDTTIAPEALGYMLRCFFEGLRRHIALEEELLVPLVELAGRTTRSALPAAPDRGPRSSAN